MLPRTRLLAALGLLLALAGPCRAETFSGKVVGVSDGDTIRVLRQGREVRVRVCGIDCPEKAQAFSQKAKQFSSKAVYGKAVTVEVRDTDRYGRLVAVVQLPGQRDSLSAALVRAGLAWAYRRYSTEFVPLEEQAASAETEQARGGASTAFTGVGLQSQQDVDARDYVVWRKGGGVPGGPDGSLTGFAGDGLGSSHS